MIMICPKDWVISLEKVALGTKTYIFFSVNIVEKKCQNQFWIFENLKIFGHAEFFNFCIFCHLTFVPGLELKQGQDKPLYLIPNDVSSALESI